MASKNYLYAAGTRILRDHGYNSRGVKLDNKEAVREEDRQQQFEREMHHADFSRSPYNRLTA